MRSSRNARSAGTSATPKAAPCSSSKTTAGAEDGIAEAFGDQPLSDPTRIDSGSPPDLQAEHVDDKGHPRLETRRIATTGLAQIARLSRLRKAGDKVSLKSVHLITSLSAAEVDTARFAALSRALQHRLHDVRDGSIDDNRCRIRAGARALACLRNNVHAVIRRPGRDIRVALENLREDSLNGRAS